jgi:hypothetical protein
MRDPPLAADLAEAERVAKQMSFAAPSIVVPIIRFRLWEKAT